ncbi:uncharacterized protein N7498_006829 [Penicillium cinerascens]|uniref:Cation-transporting P-type ATPase C-terminal domain-containing protein n=1 Tax=Penicillium cinerascens TaxID=70096 RepID=A0A9W9JKP5_9EURO|nr:uncharacterized protein N7498_006829 [Penicillium cinerascens]KAJ5197712.1 hypothetical protein N7498_006829 [Penicillium cinerascens]
MGCTDKKCELGDTSEETSTVGNEALMADHNVHIPNSTTETLDMWKAQGKSISLVAIKIASGDGTGPPLPVSTSWDLMMTLAVSDPLRQEAFATIQALKKRGIEVWMISGDNPTTATAVGTMVGIPGENIIANVLPGQKAEKFQYLQRTLKKVSRNAFGRANEYIDRRATIAMVGDGINDSPALAMADVGVAIGSGSDIAISSADFILVSSRLNSLLTLIDLSRIVFKRIKFNFAWALVYNLIALPVAAGVLYPVKTSGGHIRLDPVWASLAMALSSDILLWVGNKEKGTQHHIRQIEGLISEFSRILIDEKRQVTLNDMGWKPK